MPKVDLVATKDFTYNTRRLTAAEPFQARNALDARILTRVRKVAEAPALHSFKELKAEPKPIEAVKVATTVKAAPKPAAKKAPAKRKAKAKK